MTEALRIPAADLGDLIAAVLEAEGMPAAHARTTAEVLVWADLRGIAGHGARRLETYLGFIARGDLDPRARPQVMDMAAAAFLCASARAAGPVAMTLAADHVAALAARAGAAFGLIRETTHTGAIGCYVERLADKGLIGIAAAAGPMNMAYHGSKAAALSTSPIAIGVPAAEGPLVLDMATGALSMGGLREMAERGEPLLPGLALDAEGRPTLDPSLAAIPLPLGGAKGSGLAFMIECLSSLLAGAPIAAPVLHGRAKRRHVQNAFIIAIDVKAFRPVEGFTADLADYVSAIHGLPRQQGIDALRAPGERGREAARLAAIDGIALSAGTQRLLRSAAADRGVRLPPALSLH